MCAKEKGLKMMQDFLDILEDDLLLNLSRLASEECVKRSKKVKICLLANDVGFSLSSCVIQKWEAETGDNIGVTPPGGRIEMRTDPVMIKIIEEVGLEQATVVPNSIIIVEKDVPLGHELWLRYTHEHIEWADTRPIKSIHE